MELKELNGKIFEEIMQEFFGDFVLRNVEGVEICVLITKKSYCAYHLLNDNSDTNDIRWYSDRYFTKCLDFTDFKDKKIAIIDDTINTAYNFRKFYKMMVRQCGNGKKDSNNIVPVACLMNDAYYYEWKKTGEICSNRNEEFDDYDRMFFDSLMVYCHGDPSIVGKMSIYETKEFFRNLIPYVVDLPIIKEKGSKTTTIVMDNESFFDMLKVRPFWSFHEVNYDIVPGNSIKGGFFLFSSDFLEEVFGDFLQAATVRMQYRVNLDDDSVEFYLVPYAEMRSIRLHEIETCFYSMFEGSEYEGYVNKYKDGAEEDNYYTALYRAVVYYLSFYIALQFISQMGLTDRMDITLGDQFSDSFFASMEKVKKKDLKTIRSEFNKIHCDFSIALTGETAFSSNAVNEMFGDKDWSAVMYGQMIEHKRNSQYYFTSEEFDSLMSKGLATVRESERNVIITKVLLEALDKSVICNYLEIDRKYGVLKRGYRYGENSELIMPYDARLFYQGIYSYYLLVGEDFNRFMAEYDDFVAGLLRQIEHMGVLGNIVSPKEFVFLARYFKNVPSFEFDTIIKGKRYLLDEDCCSQSQGIKEMLFSIDQFVKSFPVEELKNV